MKSSLARERPKLPPGKIPAGRKRTQVLEWDVENIYQLLHDYDAAYQDLVARVSWLEEKLQEVPRGKTSKPSR